jgi:signal transduction histidine kinase
LQNPQIDPGSRRAFAQIVDEGSKAAVLLGDMLTLARADSECSDMQWEPVDLAAVLDQVCEKARSLAEARNLSISITSPIGSNVNIKGDYLTLRRLVWIMLDNAIKYTPAPGRIDVILSTDQRQATLLVRDSGIGISKADLPFIFDRFYRVDPSRSQVEGSGLGLAIAKWITEMHHADLSVVSEEDQGTTFHIVFPLCGT